MGKSKLVGRGGAWKTAQRIAREKGKPKAYAVAILRNMMGKCRPAAERSRAVELTIDKLLRKAKPLLGS